MKQINDINEVHRLLLDMLKVVDEHCRKEGIHYSLAYGTLLGAVRHKGFIPWDDDVDLLMPRPDYEKFIKTFDTPRYKVLYNTDTEDAYFFNFFAKVHDTTTVSVERKQPRYRFGVNLDIFPVDGKPDTEEEQRTHERACRRTANRLYLRQFPLISKKYKPILAMIETRFHSTLWWQKKCEDLMKKYPYETSKYCGAVATQNNGLAEVFEHSLFEDLSEYEFEGCRFFGFTRYDEFLRQQYGDYMQLPPVEQRKVHSMMVYYK